MDRAPHGPEPKPDDDPVPARPTSLHDRIVGDVERRILSGEWQPGRRIPFETDLARSYGCARMTVNKALTRLARAGLLERRRKSGTFVRAPRSQSAVLEIHDIEQEIAARGQSYRYLLRHRERRRAEEEDRSRLDLGRADDVVSLDCLHFTDDLSFCHETRLISLTAVPAARETDFRQTPPGGWLLRQVPWSAAEHLISSEPAGPVSGDALGCGHDTPCLVVERRTWLRETDITWARLVYPGSRHRLSARFTPRS